MPELPTFIFRPNQPRRRAIEGGVAVPGAPGGAYVPDVSGIYRQTAGLGQDFGEIGGQLSEIAARWQKAQDTAKLTMEEARLDEFMGNASDQILQDKSIDPEQYRPLLEQQRQQYLDESKQRLPQRLHELWDAKAYSSTQRAVIEMGRTGRKESISRATEAFDLRQQQLMREIAQTADPEEHARLQDEQRNLTTNYVQTGIFSAVEGTKRLQGIRDQTAQLHYENAIRLDTDSTLAQLEKGPGANPALNPADIPKLIDKARQIQSERWHFAADLEAKTERDTKQLQNEAFAQLFGTIQKNPGGAMKMLNAARDARQISPENYEMGVRFMNQRIREGRSEAMQAQHLAIAEENRRNQETEARLSIYAMTGEMSKEDIINYATAHKLPGRAIDGAIGKAIAKEHAQQSEYGRAQSQAEQILSKAFTRGPFDVLEPVTARAYESAMEELTRRSLAHGGKEDPIAVANEIIPKYQQSLAREDEVKIQGFQSRLLYPTPQDLEMARPTIPNTLYEEQKKLMYDLGQLQQKQAAPPKPAASPGIFSRVYDYLSGPKREAPSEGK
jgi:hypothetical protein